MDAQSELAALRGEIVVLREAVEFYANQSNWNYDGPEANVPGYGYDGTEYLGPANDEGERARQALTATPTAAALGALVEAALSRHKAKKAFQAKQSSNPDEITASWQEWTDAEKAEDAAADAVLAMEKGVS